MPSRSHSVARRDVLASQTRPDACALPRDAAGRGLKLGCHGAITATCNVTAQLSRKVYDDFFAGRKQTHNDKLCEVRSSFDNYNLISGLHTYYSKEDLIYKNILPPLSLLNKKDKMMFFWNNRNARRKQSGTLIYWFKEWLDKTNNHDKAQLIMHTDPKDPHGQDLDHLIRHLNLNTERQVLLSVKMLCPKRKRALVKTGLQC